MERPPVTLAALASRLVPGPSFDVSPDGLFLMVQKDEAEKPAGIDGIVVTLNWFTEYARSSR